MDFEVVFWAKWFIVPSVFVGLIALNVFYWSNISHSASALLGGLSFLIPQWGFTRYYMSGKNLHSKEIVKKLYVGEIVKIFFTVIIFALSFLFFNIQGDIFFAVFIFAQFLASILSWKIKDKGCVKVRKAI